MKNRASKLDPYAERLEEMLSPPERGGKGLTLAEAQEQLALDGCKVSAGRLSEWWSERCSQHLQERLLEQIATGARSIKEVEASLKENPAPELAALMSLHRVLILKLSTEGNAEPEMLKLVNGMMLRVMQFEKLGQTKAQLQLDRERFQRDTCELFLRWVADQRAKEIANGGSSNGEKIEQLGELMFGPDWQTASGPKTATTSSGPKTK